jgi:hypothetical protein
MTTDTPVTNSSETTQSLRIVPRFERPEPGDLAGAEPGWYLMVGGESGSPAPIPEGSTKIGRGFSVGIRLDDHTVSRSHAVVVCDGDGLKILDDRSSNGTFVNDERVEESPLADGDIVALGRVVLVVRRHQPDRG